MSQSIEDDSADIAEDGLYSVADTVNAKADESEFINRNAMKQAQSAAASEQQQDEEGDEDGDSNKDNSANSGDSFKDNPASQ